jgi:hypothetical protein
VFRASAESTDPVVPESMDLGTMTLPTKPIA